MLQEIDRYTGTVNLEGENIIPGCREMTKFLKEKMAELKDFALSHKFKDDAEEIRFSTSYTRLRVTAHPTMNLPLVITNVRLRN